MNLLSKGDTKVFIFFFFETNQRHSHCRGLTLRPITPTPSMKRPQQWKPAIVV